MLDRNARHSRLTLDSLTGSIHFSFDEVDAPLGGDMVSASGMKFN